MNRVPPRLKLLSLLLLAIPGLILASAGSQAFGAGDAPPSYAKDIFPILRANCFACHQDAKKQGGYLMTTFEAMLQGGESQHVAIVPGKAAESYLIHEITPVNGKAEMPKNGKTLSDVEIELVRRWIDAGAINDLVAKGPEFSALNPPKYAQPPSIGSIDFSPDGKTLAIAGYHEILLLETQNWELQQRLVGMSPRIESLHFSPDGKWIAAAAGEQGVAGELQLWNAENKSLHRSQALGGDTLFGINWAPDGSLISFGMSDNTIRAVDREGVQRLYQRAHEDWPRATVFTVDGKHLISVARDMTVKLIEVETERFIDNITSITPGALRGGIQALARNPHRNEIVVGGADGTPKIYRTFRQTARVIGDDANLLRQLESMRGRIFSTAISPDAKYIAAASTIDNQSEVQLWSYDVEAELPEEIRMIQTKPMAERTAEEMKKLDAFTPAQPKLLHKWTIPNAAVYSVALDANGRIVAGASDGHLRVWSCIDGHPILDRDVTPEGSRVEAIDASFVDLRLQRLQAIGELHRSERTNASDTNGAPFPTERIAAIDVQPASIDLTAWNDSVQLVVSATLDNGEIIDGTRNAQFECSANGLWLSERGWVQPVKDDRGVITVRLGKHEKQIPVTVQLDPQRQIEFARDVNPVLSRLGCNAGTCHGAQAGKNGFKLSLRGYDPLYDVRSLADDLAGRRINPSSPRDSLIMTKPLGIVPHVGGKLMEPGDSTALVIRQWISEGAKFKAGQPKVARIEIAPSNPVVQSPGAIQQVRVIATYADGKTRDVTREAFIESGNGEVASIVDGARVQATRRGEAPILARYEGAYSATTLTVMGDRSGYDWAAAEIPNAVDRFVAAKWQRMKIKPSELCTDADFLRRVSLDLTGMPPSSDKVRAFIADATPQPEKRNRLIEELLASDAYIDHWTNKWSDLLQVNSKFLGKEGAQKFRDWIRESIATNKPYDRFVHEIVNASGSNRENPAASYYKILRTPEETVENSTHLFLGVRFNCNKCHDHPFERWTQDQYYQTAAFFAQVGLKKDEVSGDKTIGGSAVEGAKPLFEEVYDTGSGEVKHQKTAQPVPPKFPFDCDYQVADGSSRRAQFAAWLTSKKNPYFAKSFVNRTWGYLMGKGLIEPIDDIRAGNPASIPELLEYLEHEFIDHQFDVRQVMRTICQSQTYQLAIDSNRWNVDDDRNYSHALPRRLPAEVLYDAIHQVTGSTTKIPGLSPGARAASLADADAGLPDGFLNNLGRPPRESACECERSSELRLGSVMALVSGPTLGSAIADRENSIKRLVDQMPDDRQLIDELFMRVLNRPATPLEIDAAAGTMQLIEQDHQRLVGLLAERDAWWADEKPKRQSLQDKERTETQDKLAARELEIRPAREAAEAARTEKIANAKSAVESFEAQVDAKLEGYLNERRDPTPWQTLTTLKAESSNGTTLAPQGDRSIVAKGAADKGIYTINSLVPGARFNTVRLEALSAPDLPAMGPGLADNGNLVVTELELFVGNPEKPSEMRKIKLTKGLSDFDQAGFSAAGAIDDKLNDQGGWAIYGATGTEHWLVFSTQAPVEMQPGEVVQWRIHQFHEAAKHRLGRFRLSVAQTEGELKLGLSENLSALANTPKGAWTEAQTKEGSNYFKLTSAELRGLRETFNRESLPIPEDEMMIVLRKRIERLSVPLVDDSRLIRLRADVLESDIQRNQMRLTAAEDIMWALINSPAFLFNH